MKWILVEEQNYLGRYVDHIIIILIPESDKDYKVFVAINIWWLIFDNQFSKSYIGETEDFDVHDIRKHQVCFGKQMLIF